MAEKNEAPEVVADEVKEAPKAKFDFAKLNTLSVVSLATAVTGFGAVAGVITGHISLAQIKKTAESGRGMAIAGIAVGYAVIGFWILSTVFWAAAGIWGLGHLGDMPGRNGEFGGLGGGFGDRDGDGGMGGHMNGGQMNGGQGFQMPEMPGNMMNDGTTQNN
jgi:hypothetical protein